ncbi:unnamed protein product [Parnassius mnemosyne]|uniref:Uncharacterized protein n=1 Tax=Parnassius mnemosyne TaxID=213953 RepID=A0AAV1KIP8_9NEOP
MFYFHSNFYHTKNKIDQNNYILHYCKMPNTKRKRPKDNSRSKNMSVQYFVRKHKSRKNLQVCRQAFLDILLIKPSRLKGVLTRHWKSGCVAEERRGGNRKEYEFRSKKEAVIKFIQFFKPL